MNRFPSNSFRTFTVAIALVIGFAFLVRAPRVSAQDQKPVASAHKSEAPDVPPAFSAEEIGGFYQAQSELTSAQLNLEHSPLFEAMKAKEKEYRDAQKALEDSPAGQAVKSAQKPAQSAFDALSLKCAVVKPPAPPKFVPAKGPDGKPVCQAPAKQ